MKLAAKLMGIIALLLLVASYPACQYGESLVQPELAKLSAEERELRQFDMEYVRYVLPGVMMFFAGTGLAVVALVTGIVHYVTRRDKGV